MGPIGLIILICQDPPWPTRGRPSPEVTLTLCWWQIFIMFRPALALFRQGGAAILTFSRRRANSCGPKWWLEPNVSRLSAAPPGSHTPNLFRHLSVWTRHPQRQSWDVEVLRMTILGCNCAGFVDTTCCCHQWPRLFRCLLCISAKLVHHPNIKFKIILNLICNCFYRHTCILHNVFNEKRSAISKC